MEKLASESLPRRTHLHYSIPFQNHVRSFSVFGCRFILH